MHSKRGKMHLPANYGETLRVFDPDFVKTPRYAQLLAAEIPAQKRTETLIEIYRRKREGDATALGFIVKAILELLSDGGINDFLAVVSDDLRTTRNSQDVRIVLQILPRDLWTEIDEAARLRTENKLVSSIDEGEYDPYIDEMNAEGAMGTWASGFIKNFSSDLLSRLGQVFVRKLESDNTWERAYVFKFFVLNLPWVFQTRDRSIRCVEAICAAAGHEEPWNREALSGVFWAYPEDWRAMIGERLRESDPPLYRELVGEEIPF